MCVLYTLFDVLVYDTREYFESFMVFYEPEGAMKNLSNE